MNCNDQAKIDCYCSALLEGGRAELCGWLQDRFGLYRPIVPKMPAEMMSDPDRVRANHAAHAMLQMTKFDLAALKAAYEGTG